MTVDELIQLLQVYDPSDEVRILDSETAQQSEITDVEDDPGVVWIETELIAD